MGRKATGCRDCGGPKPPGSGTVYCTACSQAKAAELPLLRKGKARNPNRTEEERAADRERRRRDREDPEKRARLNKANREWRARKAATEEGRAYFNARQSAYHHANREHLNEQKRLRHEAERAAEKGLTVLRVVPPPPDRRAPAKQVEIERAPRDWRVPSKPLADAIRKVAADTRPEDATDIGQAHIGIFELVCERVGVYPRNAWAWEFGERPLVDFYRAVDVLDKLDLHWWEVWTSETVRRPIITAHVRGYKIARGVVTARTITKTTFHGDAGIDQDRLAFIEAMFEATSDEETEEAVGIYQEAVAGAYLVRALPEFMLQAWLVSHGVTAPLRDAEDVAA